MMSLVYNGSEKGKQLDCILGKVETIKMHESEVNIANDHLLFLTETVVEFLMDFFGLHLFFFPLLLNKICFIRTAPSTVHHTYNFTIRDLINSA